MSYGVGTSFSPHITLRKLLPKILFPLRNVQAMYMNLVANSGLIPKSDKPADNWARESKSINHMLLVAFNQRSKTIALKLITPLIMTVSRSLTGRIENPPPNKGGHPNHKIFLATQSGPRTEDPPQFITSLFYLRLSLLHHYITGVLLTRMCVFTSKYWVIYSFLLCWMTV